MCEGSGIPSADREGTTGKENASPDGASPIRGRRNPPFILISVVCLAFFARLGLALLTFGTNDSAM